MENAEAGCSYTPAAKVKRHVLCQAERVVVNNVYEGLRAMHSEKSRREVITLCAKLTKFSERTVNRVVKKVEVTAPRVRGSPKKFILDNDTKCAIRRKIHGFFFKNEIPTVKKMLTEIESDVTIMPNISRRVFLRTLREMNFRYLKRNRKSALKEKSEIVLRRRKYLEAIRKLRGEGKKIYYTDETWVNEG